LSDFSCSQHSTQASSRPRSLASRQLRSRSARMVHICFTRRTKPALDPKAQFKSDPTFFSYSIVCMRSDQRPYPG
jgi:hypothetical protein